MASASPVSFPPRAAAAGLVGVGLGITWWSTWLVDDLDPWTDIVAATGRVCRPCATDVALLAVSTTYAPPWTRVLGIGIVVLVALALAERGVVAPGRRVALCGALLVVMTVATHRLFDADHGLSTAAVRGLVALVVVGVPAVLVGVAVIRRPAVAASPRTVAALPLSQRRSRLVVATVAATLLQLVTYAGAVGLAGGSANLVDLRGVDRDGLTLLAMSAWLVDLATAVAIAWALLWWMTALMLGAALGSEHAGTRRWALAALVAVVGPALVLHLLLNGAISPSSTWTLAAALAAPTVLAALVLTPTAPGSEAAAPPLRFSTVAEADR